MRNSILKMSLLVMCIVTPSIAITGEVTQVGGSPAKLDMTVEELVLCAAIKDRSPAGVADTFPSDIYSVCCYTKLAGSRDTPSITHVWYHGRTKMAEMKLAVRSLPWRTWSSKQMRKDWKGEWKVEVVTSDGVVIASKKFFKR